MSHQKNPQTNQNKMALRIVLKALVLFIVLSLVFGTIIPIASLGKLSLYNSLLPGRKRLPYGDVPQKAYNLSLFSLEAMFASHELNGKPKSADEYRVIFIGDSATWGFLLYANETLPAQLDQLGIELPHNRKLKAYNLAYPVMSLTKDLLILKYALRFQPDLIIWPMTLESFPKDKQLFPPLLQHNADIVRSLIHDNQLNLDADENRLEEAGFLQHTLIGSRREIADIIRLQLYGVMWAATGIDVDIPENYPKVKSDLPADETFHEFNPPNLPAEALALDVIQAGIGLAGETPVLLVNEPMFISQGENNDIRYNFYYPRWAYDAYRQWLADESADRSWHYLDLWDKLSADEFTNTAVHYTPSGAKQIASMLVPIIFSIASGTSQ